MLATEQGRSLIIQGLADQTGIDPVDAECFLDGLSVETMADLSILQSPGTELDLNSAQQQELSGALSECGLAVDVLQP